jgi:hypothetical protein
MRLRVEAHPFIGFVVRTCRFIEVHVNSLELQVRVSVVRACGVDAMLVRNNLPKLKTRSKQTRSASNLFIPPEHRGLHALFLANGPRIPFYERSKLHGVQSRLPVDMFCCSAQLFENQCWRQHGATRILPRQPDRDSGGGGGARSVR